MQLQLDGGWSCSHLKAQLGWMSKTAHLHDWQVMLAVARKLS